MADELRAVHNAWMRYAKERGMDPTAEAEQNGPARFSFAKGWRAALVWERGRRRRAKQQSSTGGGQK